MTAYDVALQIDCLRRLGLPAVKAALYAALIWGTAHE
jgi:hypothetical protein